jgi:RimJ/RimL family protein N-acetyltransferase
MDILRSSVVPETEKLVSMRLLLRNWTEKDRAQFVRMHADAEVMHDHPAVSTQAESVAKFERYRETIRQYGFDRWAIEHRCTGDFLGYTGIQPVRSDLPLAPGFEIGWRFCRHAWGHGYATESARLALADVFFSMRTHYGVLLYRDHQRPIGRRYAPHRNAPMSRQRLRSSEQL